MSSDQKRMAQLERRVSSLEEAVKYLIWSRIYGVPFATSGDATAEAHSMLELLKDR